jgi:hypothetical protein
MLACGNRRPQWNKYGSLDGFTNGVVMAIHGSNAPIGSPDYNVQALGYFMESDTWPWKTNLDYFQSIFKMEIHQLTIKSGMTYQDRWLMTFGFEYHPTFAVQFHGDYGQKVRILFRDPTIGLDEHTWLMSVNVLAA